jgi:hypothetical protein
MQLSNFSIEFEQKYGFSLENKKNKLQKHWNINSFWSIGMADPFPDESTLVDQ